MTAQEQATATAGQVVELAPMVRRIRAHNPSPLTGSGTNSYLIGRGELCILDPGPDDPQHLSAIEAALAPGERITRILLSHPHLDHSALIPRLKARCGAEVLAFGTVRDGLNPAWEPLSDLGGGEGRDDHFIPDRRLADNAVIAGEGWTLRALHTPGHLGAHLCFAMEDAIFSADLAMGWSSSIVSPPDGDMADYMRSLERLMALRPRRLWPGHGEEVCPAMDRLTALRDHRLEREQQIRTALQAAPGTAEELAARIYHEIAPSLLPAAARNVLAHLLDLHQRGEASASPHPGRTALWSPT